MLFQNSFEPTRLTLLKLLEFGSTTGTPDHQMENMPGMGSGAISMGPLMLISGEEMGIRVGSSDTNIMSMGAMGSGTSWQPSSGPMHMKYKLAGDWCD